MKRTALILLILLLTASAVGCARSGAETSEAPPEASEMTAEDAGHDQEEKIAENGNKRDSDVSESALGEEKLAEAGWPAKEKEIIASKPDPEWIYVAPVNLETGEPYRLDVTLWSRYPETKPPGGGRPDGNIHPLTKALTQEDIQRLQSYLIPHEGQGLHQDFSVANEHKEHWVKVVRRNVGSLSFLKSAETHLLALPETTYTSFDGGTAVRGVLQLRFFNHQNYFASIGVEGGKIYEVDVEVKISNIFNPAKKASELHIQDFVYLSGFREVTKSD